MKNIYKFVAAAMLAATMTSCQENENWRIIPYEVPSEAAVLYVPGNHQGWDPAAEVIGKIYSVDNDGIFSGYVYLNGEFKCTTEQSWDGTNYGYADGKLSTDTEAGNLTADEGYYLLTLNTNDLSYVAEPMSWGVIGDATPGGWDEDTPLVYDPTDLKLKADITLTDGTIKFRANGGWDVNFGGTVDELVADGDNISVTAGEYQIVLDLSTPEYKMELIAK